MQPEKYYSVRMRAAKNKSLEQEEKHISGGEQLSTFDNINQTVNQLLAKGLTHSKGRPDFMQITCDLINEPITEVSPLEINTNKVDSVKKGQIIANELLEDAGVPRSILKKTWENISAYLDMKGAVLLSIHSGERMDNKINGGIRVSRMDWLESNFEKWSNHYQKSNNQRMKEALVLASKVSSHPATIAELCWSDDPEYMTGYVASKSLGYQRITQLKEQGDEKGCRIFFVDCLESLPSYINYLEKEPVFIQWKEETHTKIREVTSSDLR